MTSAQNAGLRTTRESWLEDAVETLRPRFAEIGYPLPERVHVSVGFGYGSKRENGVILGQTWAKRASEDEINHVFISPEVNDTALVLGILIHELIHVALDCEDGHRARFAEAATRLGLEGKMTEALPGDMLSFELIAMAAALGDYPHGALQASKVLAPERTPVGPDGNPLPRVHSGPATQRNRYHKVSCLQDGYTVRMVRRWIDAGLPRCGICGGPMEVA